MAEIQGSTPRTRRLRKEKQKGSLILQEKCSEGRQVPDSLTQQSMPQIVIQ